MLRIKYSREYEGTCLNRVVVVKYYRRMVLHMAADNERQEEIKGGTPATRAKNKFNAKAYDRLYPYVKAGKKGIYERAWQAGGYASLNAFIESTLDDAASRILGEER
jgi:hypothetical protein